MKKTLFVIIPAIVMGGCSAPGPGKYSEPPKNENELQK
jgi:hypothetical protein